MVSKLLEAKLPCPSCPSSDAFHRYDDGHGYCFSCNYHDGVGLNDVQYTYEYIPFRDIDQRTLRTYDVKTKIDPTGKPLSVGFKYCNGSYKVRHLDRKEFYTEGEIGKAGLFGRDKFSLGSHKYVTITEGEIDALSLHQILQSPVVSVQSATTAARDCTVDRSWLNSFERVYLCFDADAPGREAAKRVAKLFDYNKLYLVQLSRKDANEYLAQGEGEELRQIWWNSKKYLPENIVSSFADFRKILEEPPQRGIPYPFPTLTDMTYGIRRGESVLITAQEGVGKTEVMHAIEHQLLKETDDAIGAIFLEEPKRRHLQALAGVSLHRPVHLPDTGVGDTEILKAVQDLVRVDDRLHVYSHFGSDDPEVLLDTIRFLVSARSVHWVLLDHISMAVSGLAGEDERRALDYLSTRLEMMVKELNFGLIVVSHVNDMGQTRGSRYISKIADIRIDLSRNLLDPDPIGRNTTSLVVSKNRFCGKTGPAGQIVFDLPTYSYTEIANDNQDYTGSIPILGNGRVA